MLENITNGLFSNYADQLVQQVSSKYQKIEPADPLEFLTSSAYMNEDPIPFQRLLIKNIYRLWQKYPPDAEELALLEILRRNWGITLDLERTDPITLQILVLGRRATKCIKCDSELLDSKTGKYYTIEEAYKTKELTNIFSLSEDFKLKKTSNFEIMYSGKKSCYKVMTKSGQEISTTLEHKYKTLLGFKTLGELKKGDRIAISSTLNVFGESELSEEKAKMLGYMTGDGGVTDVTPTFSNTDKSVIEDFQKLIHDNISSEVFIQHKSKTKDFDYRITRKGKHHTPNPFVQFLKENDCYGELSKNKHIPEIIWSSKKEVVSSFLNALYTCDGMIITRKGKKNYRGMQIGITLASKDLAKGVRELLLRYGILPIFKYRKSFYKDKGIKKYFDAWQVMISRTPDILKYAETIGFTGEKQIKFLNILEQANLKVMDNCFLNTIPKEIWGYIDKRRKEKNLSYPELFNSQEMGGGICKSWAFSKTKLQKAANNLNDSFLKELCASNVIWDEIISIEYDGEFDTYDLSVPDYENFVTNNFIVHNSTVISYITTIEMYNLVCKGNPQQYYGIRERHPIYITHVASAGHQAEAVFTLTSDNIRRVPFFRPFIDFDKNNSTELRLFSPHDKWLNDQIINRNILVPRGGMKEEALPGSLNIKSITTSAKTHRGDAVLTLIFSEFAHFTRARIDKMRSLAQAAEENPQSDYAIAKALMPSVKDFGADGKVLMESSPNEKGGEFYRHYCIAGGIEQDIPTDMEDINNAEDYDDMYIPETGYSLIQLATWEARSTLPRESFERDFKTDPSGANSEYGAHFRNPSGNFITESLIEAVPIANKNITLINPGTWHFVLSLDAGGKGKPKTADTYALGWAHAETKASGREEDTIYYIDGFQGWDAERKDLGLGMFENIPVDPNVVLSYVMELIKDLGGRNFINEITYDQWQNQSAVSTLQGMGLPAIETTFTPLYKAEMYGDLLAKLQLGQVKMYGVDVGGWVQRWKLEMKYLQQIMKGKVISYSHPTSGPVRHDDFADVCFTETCLIITKTGIKKIKDIDIGDEVYTHKGRFRKVLNTSKRNYKGKLLDIYTKGDTTPVSVTPNHPFYILHKKECKYKVKEKGICHLNCKQQLKVSCEKSYQKGFYWEDVDKVEKNDQILFPSYNKNIHKIQKIDLLNYLPEYEEHKVFIQEDKLLYGTRNCFNLKNEKLANTKASPINRYITDVFSLLRLCGFYLAEGGISKNCVSFSFNIKEKDFIEDVQNILKNVFGLSSSLTVMESEASAQIYVYNQILSDFFSFNFGKGAANKKIPFWVYDLESILIFQLLKGYFKGDGFRAEKYGNYFAGSISENLIRQVKHLLITEGIHSYYSINKGNIGKELTIRNHASFIGKNPQHCIRIYGEGSDIFSNYLEDREVIREKHLMTYCSKEEGQYCRVIKRTEKEFEGYVYNLEVEEDNSYVTNVGAVHNCANLVHRLVRGAFPTKETIKENRLKKQGGLPQKRALVSPVKGANFHGAGMKIGGKVDRGRFR